MVNVLNFVLLSGGPGKGLWPLTNDIRSKQFIKLLKKENGEYESMVQRMHRKLTELDKNASITVVTSKAQASVVLNQLGDSVNISIEPERSHTFPAIVLATAYLTDVRGISKEEPIIVCPIDPYVDDDYYETLMKMYDEAVKDDVNLVLMGIEPSYASEKYGYIIPYDDSTVSRVKIFKEKPTKEAALSYIKDGALWNGGVFAFKPDYLLRKAHEIIDFKDYYDLYKQYESLPKISFDIAVAEKEMHTVVTRFKGQWKDLGNWSTITEAMGENIVGNGILGNDCDDVHIVNEMEVPIIAMGLSDVVIAASPSGILVSDKEQSSYILPFVDKLTKDVRFAEKSWGSYQVLDVEKDSLTIKVTLNEGHSMNYHSHKERDEVWTVISGCGETVVDGMHQRIKAGDVITMSAGCRHTVKAETELKLIEIQLGTEISADDKQKFELEY